MACPEALPSERTIKLNFMTPSFPLLLIHLCEPVRLHWRSGLLQRAGSQGRPLFYLEK
jgi:hypothetical protein